MADKEKMGKMPKRTLAYKFCKNGQVKELLNVLFKEVKRLGGAGDIEGFEDCVNVALEFGRLEIFKILLTNSATNHQQVSR